MNNFFTVFFHFKNGGHSIKQFRARDLEVLQDQIVEDLSSLNETNITEREKQILVSNYIQFRDHFQIIPIDNCINIWALNLSIPVDVYIVKTSVIVQKL